MRIVTSLLVLLPSLAATAAVSKRQADLFVGRGQIHVLASDDYRIASPADRIGCLNARGLITLDDCAVFTRRDIFPISLSSSEGPCSFQNKSMPANTDSWYGKNTHAWSCGKGINEGAYEESYYTINGFKYPFVCNGNINCFYDVPRAPTHEDNAVVAWQFFWGSQQMGITPGHLQAMWLWVPVAKGE